MKCLINTLRLQDDLGETGTEGKALAKVNKFINKLPLHIQVSYHGEAHKIEFLLNGVNGSNWATEPMSSIDAPNLSF